MLLGNELFVTCCFRIVIWGILLSMDIFIEKKKYSSHSGLHKLILWHCEAQRNLNPVHSLRFPPEILSSLKYFFKIFCLENGCFECLKSNCHSALKVRGKSTDYQFQFFMWTFNPLSPTSKAGSDIQLDFFYVKCPVYFFLLCFFLFNLIKYWVIKGNVFSSLRSTLPIT